MNFIIAAAIYLGIASIVGRGCVVLAGIFVARKFGAEAFALFVFVHVTATSTSNIAMLGMMNGLPRFIAQMQIDKTVAAFSRAILALAVVLFGLSFAVIALALVPSETLGLPEPGRKGILLTLCVTIGLNNLLIGANNGLEKFNRVAVGTFVMGAVLISGVAVAVKIDTQEILLLAYVIATLLSVLILLTLPISTFRDRLANQPLQLTRSDVRAVFEYVGPMFMATILTNTGLWLAGRSLLGPANGTQAFAEFALGLQWFGLAQIASNVVAKAVLPRLTQSFHFADEKSRSETIRIAVGVSIGGALVVMLVVLLLHPLILSLYGADLENTRLPLILFVVAAVVASPVSTIITAFIAAARYKAVLLSTMAWWGVLVGTSYIMDGKSVVYVVGGVIGAYIAQITVLRIYKFK